MIPVANPAKSTELRELAEQIQSRADFVAFTLALLKNLKQKPEEWENRDLASFLESMGAWVNDMDGYHQAKADAIPLHPSWKMLGQILLAAKVYE